MVKKNVDITTIDKVQQKCDFIEGSIVKDIRKPNLLTFASDKPPGHEFLREPKTIYI